MPNATRKTSKTRRQGQGNASLDELSASHDYLNSELRRRQRSFPFSFKGEPDYAQSSIVDNSNKSRSRQRRLKMESLAQPGKQQQKLITVLKNERSVPPESGERYELKQLPGREFPFLKPYYSRCTIVGPSIPSTTEVQCRRELSASREDKPSHAPSEGTKKPETDGEIHTDGADTSKGQESVSEKDVEKVKGLEESSKQNATLRQHKLHPKSKKKHDASKEPKKNKQKLSRDKENSARGPRYKSLLGIRSKRPTSKREKKEGLPTSQEPPTLKTPTSTGNSDDVKATDVSIRGNRSKWRRVMKLVGLRHKDFGAKC